MKKIKLMADYQCYPLWGQDPKHFGDIDPKVLPISESLQCELLDWAKEYDGTLNFDDPARSGFNTKDEEKDFFCKGSNLARLLQEELGPDWTVTYYNPKLV